MVYRPGTNIGNGNLDHRGYGRGFTNNGRNRSFWSSRRNWLGRYGRRGRRNRCGRSYLSYRVRRDSLRLSPKAESDSSTGSLSLPSYAYEADINLFLQLLKAGIAVNDLLALQFEGIGLELLDYRVGI
jgi:hypothetical protein